MFSSGKEGKGKHHFQQVHTTSKCNGKKSVVGNGKELVVPVDEGDNAEVPARLHALGKANQREVGLGLLVNGGELPSIDAKEGGGTE